MTFFLKLLTACFLLFFSSNALCQSGDSTGSLYGRIVDSSSLAALPGAYITVRNQPHLQTFSDSSGYFRIPNIILKDFEIVVTSAGYESKIIAVQKSMRNPDSVSTGSIRLRSVIKELGNVAVVSRKPLISHEVDRMIYNVGSDPESKNQNTLDLLRKVPFLAVTAENTILLKGNSNFRILLNGRSSGMFVNNPSDVLRVMPATLIDKIEVYTVPPAKYDSEGLGGIINIITNKKINNGSIGSINGNYGTLYQSLSGSYTARFNRTGFSTYVAYNREAPPRSIVRSEIDNTTNTYQLRQSGTSRIRSSNTIMTGRIDHEIDTLNLVSASVAHVFGARKYLDQQFTSLSYTGQSQSYDLSRWNNLEPESLTFDANYEHLFKKNKKRALTFSYNYNHAKENQRVSNEIRNKSANASQTDRTLFNQSNRRENTAQIDYTHPIKSWIDFSSGTKFINRESESEFYGQYLDPVTGGFEYENGNAGSLRYTQKILSAYTSVALRWKKWSVSSGIRFENTVIQAVFRDASQNFRTDYDLLTNSISILKKVNDESSLNIGYTNRIQRPDIGELNPFTDKSDPTFYFRGNPNLDPVRNHRINVGYNTSKKGFISVEASYTFSTNSIQRVITVMNDTISVSSYDNVGKNKNIGFTANGNYPISKNIRLSLNSSISYVSLEGDVASKFRRNDGIQGHGYLYLTCMFDKGITASANAGFYSPVVILQGKTNGYFYSSFSAYKSILQGKVSLSLSVVNPFVKYRLVRNRIYTSDYTQEFEYKNYFRNIIAGASYSFGKLEKRVRRNRKSIENDDLIQKEKTNEKGKY